MAGIVVVVVPRDALRAVAVATEGPPTATPTATSTALPTSTATVTPTPTATPTPVIHQVEAGDTLLSIALEYGVSVPALEEANQIGEGDFLQIGQELLIPRPTPVPAEGEQVEPTPTPRVYVVEEGDTLLGVATELDVSLESLREANDLEEESLLVVGQELVVPAPTPTPAPAAGAATPTPIALPTPDPAIKYDTPPLLWPPDGARLRAGEGAILLSWASVGVLREDEFYVVELWWTSGERERRERQWTRATSWRLPERLQPEEATRFQWRVEVRRQTAVNPQGQPIGLAISGGQERSFTLTR